jgi:hypothetical protein
MRYQQTKLFKSKGSAVWESEIRVGKPVQIQTFSHIS